MKRKRPAYKLLGPIEIRGYRAFRDWTEIDLKPFTLFYGTNSSGKSSLMELIPILSSLDNAKDLLNWSFQGRYFNLEMGNDTARKKDEVGAKGRASKGMVRTKRISFNDLTYKKAGGDIEVKICFPVPYFGNLRGNDKVYEMLLQITIGQLDLAKINSDRANSIDYYAQSKATTPQKIGIKKYSLHILNKRTYAYDVSDYFDEEQQKYLRDNPRENWEVFGLIPKEKWMFDHPHNIHNETSCTQIEETLFSIRNSETSITKIDLDYDSNEFESSVPVILTEIETKAIANTDWDAIDLDSQLLKYVHPLRETGEESWSSFLPNNIELGFLELELNGALIDDRFRLSEPQIEHLKKLKELFRTINGLAALSLKSYDFSIYIPRNREESVYAGSKVTFPALFQKSVGTRMRSEMKEATELINAYLTYLTSLTKYRFRVKEELNVPGHIAHLPYKWEKEGADTQVQDLRNAYTKYCYQLVLSDGDIPIRFDEIGSGIAQMLPILFEGADNNFERHTGDRISANERWSFVYPYKRIYVEQPELHLHPAQETEITRFMINMMKDNLKDWVLETHSEHIILALQLEVAKWYSTKGMDGIHPDDLAIYYVGQDEDGVSSLKKMELDEVGNFKEPWPDDFFESRTNLIYERLKMLRNN